MLKSCLVFVVKLREELSTREVCKRTIKDLQLHLYSLGNTMVFLYYMFATSCQACEQFLAFDIILMRDYAAEKLWKKHMGRKHKVFPNSIEISVDGNDSSMKRPKEKHCLNAEGRVDIVKEI